jgi:hypothetical protein
MPRGEAFGNGDIQGTSIDLPGHRSRDAGQRRPTAIPHQGIADLIAQVFDRADNRLRSPRFGEPID